VVELPFLFHVRECKSRPLTETREMTEIAIINAGFKPGLSDIDFAGIVRGILDGGQLARVLAFRNWLERAASNLRDRLRLVCVRSESSRSNRASADFMGADVVTERAPDPNWIPIREPADRVMREQRPIYHLTLQLLPGVHNVDHVLRQALKSLLRRHKLRCISIRQEPRSDVA
jgi:hypothetical protein